LSKNSIIKEKLIYRRCTIKIIDGNEIAIEIERALTKEVEALKERRVNPALSIIQVGENKASTTYAKSIRRKAERVGIYAEHYKLSEEVTEGDLLKAIEKINERKEINGIILELPLPENINKKIVLNAIDPDKDIDGFHPVNMGRLLEGNPLFIPATAQSVMETIKHATQIDGKRAVVIGRSTIVGKPTALLLLKENATVTFCHSHTKDLPKVAQEADILVVSTGKAKMINKNYVKRGAIVIDVGINKLNGKIVGDVDFEDVKNVAGAITPVPGGIGVLTTLMLLKNTVKAAKIQNRIDL
jgi:methylenetetrahydrofolate dehydrogenase (NADP+)/methenyltetrahydrofolate cyclohydrolase